MSKQVRAKQSLVVEAVRSGLDGDAAVQFIHESGYAISTPGIARHLRSMGGRGHVEELIQQGKGNAEILRLCFPEADEEDLVAAPPSQGELFGLEEGPARTERLRSNAPLFESTKLSIRIPSDLYEALRLAARAEGKTQNAIIVEILESALGRMSVATEDQRQGKTGSAG